MFWDTLEKFGESTALITESNECISYRSLIEKADKIGSATGERCLVFLMCYNCVDAVAGYIGFLRYNAVPLMLGIKMERRLLDNLLEIYHPAFIFCPHEVAVDFKGEISWRNETYTLVSLEYAQDYKLADELAALLTTSGSTGSPKLVRQTARNIEINAQMFAEYLEIRPEDRAITTLPLQHTYGLTILQSHFLRGATVILSNKTLLDRQFWLLLKEQRATTFGGVPYHYEMLMKLGFGRMELPYLRYITQAGGKLPIKLTEDLNETCRKKKIKLIVMYGQTEAVACMAYLPWEYAVAKQGSIGIADPGGELRLCDESGKEIDEPDVTGELVYRGENVTLGYAENRFDLNKPDENNGELYTGDMATRDADGFYYIVGRKKRFLKLFGYRVNLDELESLLNQQGIPCACTGVDDHMKVYVTDQDKLEAVAEFLKKHTSISPNSFTVHFINEIPRNETGKVLYSGL